MTGARIVLIGLAAGVAAGLVSAASRYDAELAAAVREVGDRLAKVRGGSPASPSLAVRASEAERRAASAARVDAAVSPDRLAARGRAFRDLGFGNAEMPVSLYRALASDLPDFVPSADGKRLLVAEGRLTEADFTGGGVDETATALLLATGIRPDEPSVAHVLTHFREAAGGPDPRLRETTDATLAACAWREGEANLAALLLLYTGLGLESEVVEGRIPPEGFLEGALVAPIGAAGSPTARRLLEFVYLDGFAAAAGRLRRGGWAAIEALRNGPPSTRNVLHPDRTQPATGRPALAPPTPPEGFTLADRDVLGEAAISILVAEATGKDNLGMLAADGWDGDLLVRWEREGGDGITHWETRWVSEEDAGDFEYSLGRVLEARFGPREKGGEEADVVAGGQAHQVRRRGAEVVYRISPAGFFPVDGSSRIPDKQKIDPK